MEWIFILFFIVSFPIYVRWTDLRYPHRYYKHSRIFFNRELDPMASYCTDCRKASVIKYVGWNNDGSTECNLCKKCFNKLEVSK